MPIPNNINRENVFQALIKINREGIPANRDFSTWALNYEGKAYPCKLVISWANIYANGIELNPNPTNFNSITAGNFLRRLGFSIVEN